MTTEIDLRRAIETAFVHCRSGGVAVFVPDNVDAGFEANGLTEQTTEDRTPRELFVGRRPNA